MPKTPRINEALVTTLVTDFPITSAVLGSSFWRFVFAVTSSCSCAVGWLFRFFEIKFRMHFRCQLPDCTF